MASNTDLPFTPQNDEQENSARQEVSAIQAAVEDVTQNYLETLDALSTVYDVADGFAQLFDSSSIAEFTLARILECLEVDCGAIFLVVGGELRFYLDAKNAQTHLDEEAIEDASLEGRTLFCNGPDALQYLQAGVEGRNVLLAPVVAAQRRLGIVVVSSDQQRCFTTKDLKLVGAVTSQAAIALSGAQHLEQAVVERQKFRSIIEDSGGGIVVLSPDGRTMLTNRVARELLGLPKDRAEGFSLIDVLANWKFSQEPECLCGDGPTELALEIALGSGPQERAVSVVGRRVRTSDGALASIVLNLQDSTEKRRDERTKEDLLSVVSKAFRLPIETMSEVVRAKEGTKCEGGAGCGELLQPHLDELAHLADHLQLYVSVLDSSWTGSGRTDLIRVASAKRDALLAHQADPGSRIELALDPTASEVEISEECAHLIVDTLLNTAFENGSGRQSHLCLASRRLSEGWIALSVEDRGTGDSGETRQGLVHALGRPGEDLTVEEAGRGIRLALVQEVARQIGGEFEASVGPEGGAVLRVTLPASP